MAANIRDEFENTKNTEANFNAVTGSQSGRTMRFFRALRINHGRNPTGNSSKKRPKQNDFIIRKFHVSAILQYGYL